MQWLLALFLKCLTADSTVEFKTMEWRYSNPKAVFVGDGGEAGVSRK